MSNKTDKIPTLKKLNIPEGLPYKYVILSELYSAWVGDKGSGEKLNREGNKLQFLTVASG